jgi:hypothetical protein
LASFFTFNHWSSLKQPFSKPQTKHFLQPSLISAEPSIHTVLGCVLQFLPLELFRTTILQATNKAISDPPTWDEFLRVMAILLLFGLTKGIYLVVTSSSEEWALSNHFPLLLQTNCLGDGSGIGIT